MLIRKMPHTMFMYAKIDKRVLRFRNKYQNLGRTTEFNSNATTIIFSVINNFEKKFPVLI